VNYQFTPDSVQFQIVNDDAQLRACCERWQKVSAIALDTEFMRVSTFYPQTALFQVAEGDSIWLIDPLPITDWTPLREVLTSPDVIKVLHSCSEDLLVFQTCTGVLPAPLFDTQIAAAYLSEGSSISYQNLVRLHTEIELPKGETRSDWLQRPLSDEQQRYAALDVAYLLPLWEQQSSRLREQGRLAWLEEDCARMLAMYTSEISGDFAEYYQNFKAGWQLAPQQLAVLQKLAEWRELRARKRDRPRNWILKDTSLFGIALAMPQTRGELALISEISDNFVRHEGDQVLALVAQARAMPQAESPVPIPKPLSQGQKNRIKRAQEYVEQKALELTLQTDVLARKRLITALLYAHKAVEGKPEATLVPPAEFNGWRGPVLLEALNGIMRA